MTFDVVAETETPEAEPILAVAGGDAFKFFYIVLAAPVVRVVLKNGNGAGKVFEEVGVLLRKLPEVAIEGAGSPD